jgi:RteC protein.
MLRQEGIKRFIYPEKHIFQDNFIIKHNYVMEKFFNQRLLELESGIKELEIEPDFSIQRIEAGIELIVRCLATVKEHVLTKGFKDTNEEIQFFKHRKPIIVSKLIFYNSIYRIETKKPYGCKATKKYLNRELRKLKRYFDENLEFYKYYRTNNTYLDEILFVRGKHDYKLCLEPYYIQSDHNFSSSHDYKVAEIIANDMIQVYIEDQLYNSRYLDKRMAKNPNLNWTSSKTALIELIYAMHAQGVFDHGNADIKVITKKIEKMFNVDLGDFYHTYLELRGRKINRTKFIDTLRESLVKKMDEQDEK